MTTQRWTRRKAATALLAVAGIALALGVTYRQLPTRFDTRPPGMTTSDTRLPERAEAPIVQSAEKPATNPDLEAVGRLSLRLDTAPPASFRANTAQIPLVDNGVDARAADAFVESPTPKPLDLNVPDETPSTAATRGTATERAAPPTQAGAPTELTLPQTTEDFDPNVDSFNLFNPEYGLRGFMKQSWISRRVALQTGLGINDDRLIDTEGDRRDDIAFGMGVIVAF